MNDAEKALKFFRWSAVHIPAYKRFLKKRGVSSKAIHSTADFSKVPVMDKANYLRAYPYKELFRNGEIPPFLSMSSGSSGKPFYWPRSIEQEKRGGYIHEIIFRDIFGITKKERTLVIIGFSMGTWIAGMFTVNSCREMVEKGYRMTIASPGIEKEDILAILNDFAPHFDTVILAGYPPFLMDVIVEAERRHIKIKNINLKLLFAGENFSERWRSRAHEIAGIKKHIGNSVSVYGSADADVLGHETPLSIFIRRKAGLNQKFAEALWGDVGFLPTLVQYHPSEKFFESVDGELVFTAQSGIPLIRYNIHDRGRIVLHKTIAAALAKFGYAKEAKKYGLQRWKMPFLTLAGRNDVAVTFYGLNIYPENIKAGLEDSSVARYVTGKFITFTKSVNREKSQKLIINAELQRGIAISPRLEKAIRDSIFRNLISLNIEYRKLSSSIAERAHPIIKITKNGSPIFQVRKAKHQWIQK